MKNDDWVVLEFKDDFVNQFKNTKYRVEFKFSRTTYLREHIALDVALEMYGIDMLIPQKVTTREHPLLDVGLNDSGDLIKRDAESGKDVRLKWFNGNLNDDQKRTVCRNLRGEFSLPYLINGPPGKQTNK